MVEYKAVYRNLATDEIVDEEDSVYYVLDTLGIEITPKDKDNTYTLEQQEFIENTVEWFFSGNWTKEYIKEQIEEIPDLILADMVYEDNVNKRLLEE